MFPSSKKTQSSKELKLNRFFAAGKVGINREGFFSYLKVPEKITRGAFRRPPEAKK
jgi:hypothetical protein